MLKHLLPALLISIPALATVPAPDAHNSICPPPSSDVPSWTDKNGNIHAWMSARKIVPLQGDISPELLVQFAREYDKIPPRLQHRMIRKGAWVHLIQGNSVVDDPSFTAQLRRAGVSDQTFDGRDWNGVAGSGGAPYAGYQKVYYPTRVVINKMFNKESHGSRSVFLHEHGHALDSLESYRGISDSAEWRSLQSNDEGLVRLLKGICGKYCTDNADEGFAEAFAFYYSCGKNQRWMNENVPVTASFLQNLARQ